MKRRPPPSKEAFEKLLVWLNPDREQAAEKYQRIHSRLIRIFAAKGCFDAESLADETVNAVALKIDWLSENYRGDPALYFYGVAKKIFLEQLRQKPIPDIPPPPDNSEIELRCGCLERCLLKVTTPDERRWVLRYHEGEKQIRIQNRKRMAEELGISANALRIRICHLQARLHPCIEECLKELAR